MKILIATGIAAGAILFGGCSNSPYDTVGATNTYSGNGNPGGATPPTMKSASTALYQVNAGLLPYPYDAWFAGSTDGTLNIQPASPVQPNQAAVNALDGFSTTASIRERFNGPLDVSSLAAPGAVTMVHISTNNLTKAPVSPAPPQNGTFVPLKGCVAGGATCTGANFDYSVGAAADDPTILEIFPLHPLAASTCLPTPPATSSPCAAANGGNGEGYMVLLTNAITVQGAPAVPDADYASFQKALAGGATCPSITDASLNALCQLSGAHLALGQLLGINPANVVVSFSFSTQSTVDEMAAVYEKTKLTAQAVPPTITVQPAISAALGGQLTTKTFGGAGAANLYVGVLTIPYYLSKSAPLTGFWQAAPFALDPTSTNVTRFNPLPVATQNLQIPVLMSIPLTVPGPWPVVIFQHGITANREEVIAIADAFASKGFAVAAIDLPLHGVTNTTTDPFYASAANSVYQGLGLPAGQMSIERTFDLALIAPPALDPSGSHFINLTSLLTTRDNNREGAADLMTFELALPNLKIPASTGVTASTLAAGPVHYVGHSLGAIVGGVFLGVVPVTDVSTATLANPGGILSQLITNSPSFEEQINAGLEQAGIFPGTTLYAQFTRDSQTVIDSGDPINFIALTTAQHPVHAIQVVGSNPPPPGCGAGAGQLPGCPDQVVPNFATLALFTASAYGPHPLTQAHPPGVAATPPAFLSAFVNFTDGEHASLVVPTVSLLATEEMQTETVAFALSEGTQLPVGSVPGAPVQ